MLNIAINGTLFDGFTEARCTKTMQSLCGDFEFKAAGTLKLADFTKLINLFDLAEIYADNIKIMTGFIEVIDISYDSDNYSITLAGREKTCDVVDTRISTTFTNTATTSFKTLIDASLKLEGLSTRANNPISVVDETTSTAVAFNETDQQIAGSGESLFDFLNKYAQKKYIVMTTNADGNIVLANSGVNLLEYKINNKVGVKNNIWKASVNYNVSQLFRTYEYRCQPNYANITDSQLSEYEQNNALKYTSAEDTAIRVGRKYLEIESDAYTVQKLKDRTAWRIQTNIANSKKYNVTLNGHTFIQTKKSTILNINNQQSFANQLPLSINQLIDIDDEIVGISEIMLIESLTYNMSEQGNTLDIVFVNRNAYTLQADDVVISNKYYSTDGLV